ncbi:DUF4363 family protein [Desulforamulus ruminis]|uniref:DUF4363 family protein n=1 Tax=Desulforamulus ruminis (strain ATCC 23193 / DSM 2154 / NCIMB 8452 / DL) TaxID=696281 RepID=F6DPW0_DESRL|nr:DUF4363 family protein [Desulforamulus ruminis]AEG60799.1 hypothetical protein Desru_2572 [Desulforamulus ruminis DSM 2154]
MRLLSALLGLILVIVLLGFWVNHSLEATAKELTHNLNAVTREIKEANWDEAGRGIAAMEENWDHMGKWWPVVLDHQEMDNIEFSLAKAKAYIEEKEMALSLGQLSELKLMILHLPEREALTLRNIF